MSAIKDWDAYNAAAREQGKALNALHPELVKGFAALNRGAATTTHLDAKTRDLISLAVAVTTRQACRGNAGGDGRGAGRRHRAECRRRLHLLAARAGRRRGLIARLRRRPPPG